MHKIGFISLGCPKNLVDSEVMLGSLAQNGFVICAEPSDADVIVINTCSFIETAREEAYEVISQAIELKKNTAVRGVVVAGCLAQLEQGALYEKFPGIDGIAGLNTTKELADLLKKILDSRHPAISEYYRPAQPIEQETSRLRLTPLHYGYIRIAEGCSHKCSFCTIPAIRGKYSSKSPDAILNEAKELTEDGAVELNIIAQDTTFYGKEVSSFPSLSTLLKSIAEIEKIKWIRLLYTHPAYFDDELIETIASISKIVKYVDMPIQHCNDEVLRAMRRGYTKAQLLSLIERIRTRIPDIFIRTAVIVGFPGESDEQFNELKDFIKQVRFERLGAFCYSDERGTEAFTIEKKLSNELINTRLDEIMQTQQKIAFEFNRSLVGKEVACIIDSRNSKDKFFGRTYGDAPDVDGGIWIKGKKLNIGNIVNVRITALKDYDLKGIAKEG